MRTTFNIKTALAALALAATLATVAMAHGPGGTKPAGANGGPIVDVDGGHLELIVSPMIACTLSTLMSFWTPLTASFGTLFESS